VRETLVCAVNDSDDGRSSQASVALPAASCRNSFRASLCLANAVRPALLGGSSEENQDRNQFVVDEVVLFADRDERGISGPEPAAISFGLEGRFAAKTT
jgi:hypothetical protein